MLFPRMEMVSTETVLSALPTTKEENNDQDHFNWQPMNEEGRKGKVLSVGCCCQRLD